jgi:hypothetical protein
LASSETTGAPKPMVGRKVLNREERAALLNHHVARLRSATLAVEKAREPLSAAQADLTAYFNEAKADLGKRYTRKKLVVYVADSVTRARDLVDEERQRAEDKADLGQPVFGVQPELFGGAETPQEAKDELAWEAEGYLLGRRAGERAPPEGCPPRFLQAVLRGYDKGQEENGLLMGRAGKVLASRGEPDATAAPVNLNPAPDEPEPGTPEAQAAERASLRRGRASLAALDGGRADTQALGA